MARNVRLPTSNPSLASWLRHALLLAVVAFASSCLNPRPEDDPSLLEDNGSDPSDSQSTPNQPEPVGNDNPDLAPQLPVGPADPNDPNPNGVEGEVVPPVSSPPSSDAGLAPADGGPDAGL